MYPILTMLIRWFVRLFHRGSVHGMDTIPQEKGVIIVGNHASYLDPFYIGAFVPRKVQFMAKKSLFRFFLLRWLLKRLGAFPVDRDRTDLQSIKKALSILDQGEVVGLFPEGGIKQHPLTQLKHGAAYLSMKKNCPIVPIYIDGTDQALPKGRWYLKPTKISIRVGKIVKPPAEGTAKEKQAVISEQLLSQLQSLKGGSEW